MAYYTWILFRCYNWRFLGLILRKEARTCPVKVRHCFRATVLCRGGVRRKRKKEKGAQIEFFPCNVRLIFYLIMLLNHKVLIGKPRGIRKIQIFIYMCVYKSVAIMQGRGYFFPLLLFEVFNALQFHAGMDTHRHTIVWLGYLLLRHWYWAPSNLPVANWAALLPTGYDLKCETRRLHHLYKGATEGQGMSQN